MATSTLKGRQPMIFAPLQKDIVARGLPSGTFSRASTGTYIDPADGLLKTADVDVPRFQKDGLLLEPQSTNRVLYSDIVPVANWTKRGTGDVTTSDTIQTPTGVSAAVNKFTGVGATTTNDVFMTAEITGFTASGRLEPSFWIRRISTSGTLDMTYTQGGGAATGRWSINLALLSDGWERLTRFHAAVTVIADWTATTGGRTGLWFRATAGAPLAFYAWGYQYEAGECPTSYIPTPSSAAVTRATDNLTWPLTESLKSILSVDNAWPVSYQDQTGASFGITENKCSFADGQAWAEFSGVDISPYANSGKMIVLRDSTGKLAWGYLGAAGTGKTVGPELITEWSNFSGDEAFETFASSGKDITSAIDSSTSTYGYAKTNQISSTGAKKLFEFVTNATFNSGVTPVWYWGQVQENYPITSMVAGPYIMSIVMKDNSWDGGRRIHVRSGTSPSQLCDFSSTISIKEVLTPGVTGVYVWKDPELTQQGWTMDGAFSLNDNAYTFDIIPACRVEGTLVIEWTPNYDVSVANILQGIISANPPSAVNLIYDHNSSGAIAAYDATTAKTYTPGFTVGQRNILVLRWSSITRLFGISVKKGSAAWMHSSNTPFDGAFALGSFLELGIAKVRPAHYRNLAFYRRWLPDAEL